MALVLETGYTSINKKGEELCGDNVEMVVTPDGHTTLVLADGMGSGVKANILSTLTSKILCTMVSNDIDIYECVETIIQSLPVCKERGLAYSTFSVIHVDKTGKGYLIEFDNPEAIYMHGGKCVELGCEKLEVLDKTVYKSDLSLEENDILMIMSDGTIHAGIGMLLNFGWQRDEIKEFLDTHVRPGMSARCAAWLLVDACNDFYVGEPGDDTTVAAVRVREEEKINIMVGPPLDKSRDDFYVARFMKDCDKKIVCGGTSSQIVARYLGKEVSTSLEFIDKEIPPIGYIDGIDLTTEGVITLRRLCELSDKYLSVSDLSPKEFTSAKDGAGMLAQLLFEEATSVTFFVGQSVNVAHQGLPIDTTMKLKLVETLSKNLIKMGKTVTVNYD